MSAGCSLQHRKPVPWCGVEDAIPPPESHPSVVLLPQPLVVKHGSAAQHSQPPAAAALLPPGGTCWFCGGSGRLPVGNEGHACFAHPCCRPLLPCATQRPASLPHRTPLRCQPLRHSTAPHAAPTNGHVVRVRRLARGQEGHRGGLHRHRAATRVHARRHRTTIFVRRTSAAGAAAAPPLPSGVGGAVGRQVW